MNLEPNKLLARLNDAIWHTHLEAVPAWRARMLVAVRLLLALARDLVVGQLTLRAMSLVYTTLLSLVPLLALSFSVLKAFGVHNQLEPALHRFLAPLGAEGDELTAQIIGFIDNMNVGVLGSLGLALLLYTAVSLVHKIEESFNYIWHVTHSRSIAQRFSNYLSVLLVGPILVFAAIGLTAAVSSTALVQSALAVEPLGRIAYYLGRVAPYVLVIGAFAFIYAFVPNTGVRPGAALAGGVVGGVLWQSAGWAFTAFVAHSKQYSAIYSGFAVLVLFMIWLYLSWLILLLGASVSFYRQHPEYLVAAGGEPRLSNRMRERLALLIMGHVASAYLEGRPAWSRERFTQTLSVPMYTVDVVVDALCSGGMLAETNDVPPRCVPARDLARVSVKELLDAVRAAGEDRFLRPDRLPIPPEIEDVLHRLERASRSAVGEISVAQLAMTESAAEQPAGAQPAGAAQASAQRVAPPG
jgi:membrane protein